MLSSHPPLSTPVCEIFYSRSHSRQPRGNTSLERFHRPNTARDFTLPKFFWCRFKVFTRKRQVARNR